MTHSDVDAPDDRTPSAPQGRDRRGGSGRRLAAWVDDPLERVVLVAFVLLGAVLLLGLASARDASGMTAEDACVLTAVEQARAFAGVLGDDRPVPSSFAERACGQPLG